MGSDSCTIQYTFDSRPTCHQRQWSRPQRTGILLTLLSILTISLIATNDPYWWMRRGIMWARWIHRCHPLERRFHTMTDSQTRRRQDMFVRVWVLAALFCLLPFFFVKRQVISVHVSFWSPFFALNLHFAQQYRPYFDITTSPLWNITYVRICSCCLV